MPFLAILSESILKIRARRRIVAHADYKHFVERLAAYTGFFHFVISFVDLQ
jgi:hypothetical protein